jgi:hypothetical protein
MLLLDKGDVRAERTWKMRLAGGKRSRGASIKL